MAFNPVRSEDGKVENFMPKVNGKFFRCSCGCNVFHKPDETRPYLFECNSCETWYSGEPKEDVGAKPE